MQQVAHDDHFASRSLQHNERTHVTTKSIMYSPTQRSISQKIAHHTAPPADGAQDAPREAKYPILELPQTSHAVAAFANAAAVDTEPSGGKTPNNSRMILTTPRYQLLTSRGGPWIIYIQTLSTTYVM